MNTKYYGKTIVVKKLLEQHERDLGLFYKEGNILQLLDSRFGRGLKARLHDRGKMARV